MNKLQETVPCVIDMPGKIDTRNVVESLINNSIDGCSFHDECKKILSCNRQCFICMTNCILLWENNKTLPKQNILFRINEIFMEYNAGTSFFLDRSSIPRNNLILH